MYTSVTQSPANRPTLGSARHRQYVFPSALQMASKNTSVMWTLQRPSTELPEVDTMVRISTNGAEALTPNATRIQLNTMISRLHKIILNPDEDQEYRLRRIPYERDRVGTVINFSMPKGRQGSWLFGILDRIWNMRIVYCCDWSRMPWISKCKARSGRSKRSWWRSELLYSAWARGCWNLMKLVDFCQECTYDRCWWGQTRSTNPPLKAKIYWVNTHPPRLTNKKHQGRK